MKMSYYIPNEGPINLATTAEMRSDLKPTYILYTGLRRYS